MTEAELEKLVDLDLTGFLSALDGMSPEDLDQVRSHPVVIYIMYRVFSAKAKHAASTAEEREDALRFKEHFPASEEYYLAQARISDRRWKFQCQKASVIV